MTWCDCAEHMDWNMQRRSQTQREGLFLHATQSYEPQCANDQATEFRVTRPEIQTAIVLEENKSKLHRI